MKLLQVNNKNDEGSYTHTFTSGIIERMQTVAFNDFHLSGYDYHSQMKTAL